MEIIFSLLFALGAVWIGYVLFILVMLLASFWMFGRSFLSWWFLFLTLPFFIYLSLLFYTGWQIDPEDRDAAYLNFFYSPYTGRGALAALLVPILLQIPLVSFGFFWKWILWKTNKSTLDYLKLAALCGFTLLFLGLTIGFMYSAYFDLKQDIL